MYSLSAVNQKTHRQFTSIDFDRIYWKFLCLKQSLRVFSIYSLLTHDDDDIAYTKGIKGFNGEEILKLPTYYINENPNLDCSDLSTDVISTLCAYAEMSLNSKI